MLTQLWEAEKVPLKVPDFVDPHITRDSDCYLFEVNPFHEFFKGSENSVVVLAKRILMESGFKNPEHLMTVEKPDWVGQKCNCSMCQPRKSKKTKKSKGFGN